jgi:chromosome segregation protein
MQVDRLRLVGFKSFVDPSELTLAPGLTGIVGPNGCGKSNLVEALRWVMGEASARRLRGGEMDDVIFAGSAGRPARNIAEVTLTLDNSSRDGPFALNDRDQIEVSRRLERDAGSSYRINGREVRARDVQMLFADAATGPHSGALIGQGRVGALIGAKPSERRLLLDEAAGTGGLHARRHEAELRLRAAEDNLLRLDDVIATLAAQLDGLKKQARSAQRYRRLGEQIRQAEAQLLDARWHAAEQEAAALAAELRAGERAVAAATEQALAEERARTAAEAAVPPARQAEAAAAAALQRLTAARTALEQELAQAIAARAEAEARLGQVAADIAREHARLADADGALARLADERQLLADAEGHDAAARKEAAARLDAAAAQLAAAETGLLQMTEAAASGEARRAALERQARELGERRRRLQARLDEGERHVAALAGAAVPPAEAAAAATAVREATAALEACRQTAAAAVESLASCQAREAEMVDAAHAAERAVARLKAEAEGLAGLVAATAKGAAGPSVLSQITVPAGLEAAIGALCDGELAAPLVDPGDSAAAGWVDLGPAHDAPALPAAARPLAESVAAPAALARLLSQSGWVDSAAAGQELQASLHPGQSLVDRDGRLWRWDGFTRSPARKSAAAEQLRQRNRLAVLAADTAAAASVSEQARAAAETARAARLQAVAAERAATAALRAAEERLSRARAAEAALARRALESETRLAAWREAAGKIRVELDEAAAEAREIERATALLPAADLARGALVAARAEAAAARRREAEARTALDRLARDSVGRQRRLVAIRDEESAWQQRRAGAAAQCTVLDGRRAALDGEIAALAARPGAIAAESAALTEAAARAAAEHRAAADALAVAESRARAAAEAARRAEGAAAAAREQRARLETRRDAAAEVLTHLRGEIAERLGGEVEDLAGVAGREPGTAPADPAQTAARLDRLLRERDAMGPVNLLAEAEAAAVEAQAAGLGRERAELSEAIARLRQGIAALDQEGRKRLLAAFEQLNSHFATLFARLFGGGKAHLTLTDDADPLEAGLDIMASPPGKRLQALSLLSGGEQALTAIALIFAVFLTKPAPICVLDEVDAALDDANVDRFCRLLADTADTTGTRFLLVTHHRITMARMDRLFGVTMPERGVSQLVSVDLARAVELRQTA